MTPTKQDKELREKINHRFESVCTEGHQQSCGEYQTAVDDIMQLITADRKRVALEARLDELENRLRVQFIPSHWERLRTEVNSWAKYVDKRIAELKAQQEELGNS